MLYGALPDTVTGQLSVPHQNPGGASPAGSRGAAVAAVPPARTSARQAARVSQIRLIDASRGSHGSLPSSKPRRSGSSPP